MSKKYEIYLSDELAAILDKEAASHSMKPHQYIPDLIAKALKTKIENPEECYTEYLHKMKAAILSYIETIPPEKEFFLREIPYYSSIPSSIRIRLGRSLNDMIAGRTEDKELSEAITRAYRTSDGKLKFHGGAALYKRKERK